MIDVGNVVAYTVSNLTDGVAYFFIDKISKPPIVELTCQKKINKNYGGLMLEHEEDSLL